MFNMFDSFDTNLFNIGIIILYQNNNVYIRGYEKNILNNLITLKILFDTFILNIFYL